MTTTWPKAKAVQGYAEVGNADVSSGVDWQTLLTVNINGAGKLIADASAMPSSSSFNNYIRFRIKVDGVVKSTGDPKLYTNSGIALFPIVLGIPVQTVAPGDHVVLLEWKDTHDAGTAKILGATSTLAEWARLAVQITP